MKKKKKRKINKPTYIQAISYEGNITEKDTKTIVPELKKISKEKGYLTPEMVVDAAKPKGSKLHKFFEWKDKIAAMYYRITQAKYMIRSFHVIHEKGKPVRFMSSVIIDDKHVYVETIPSMKVPCLREQMLERAWIELKSFIEKYQNLVEFAPIVKIIRIQLKKHKVG